VSAPALTLRPATAADQDFLLELYAATREPELALVEWPPGGKESFVRQQFEAQDQYYRANYADTRFDVVEVDGQRAGRLYVARWPEEIRIVDIALLPEFRGAGAGSTLLGELLAEGAALGKRVSIHVERLNPALRLYERLGFRLVEDKGVYLFLAWQLPGDGRA